MMMIICFYCFLPKDKWDDKYLQPFSLTLAHRPETEGFLQLAANINEWGRSEPGFV